MVHISGQSRGDLEKLRREFASDRRLCLLWYLFDDVCFNFSDRIVADDKDKPDATAGKSRGQLKCDGTRAETRFRLSAKWTRQFKSAGASVQSTAGSRGVRISGSNAGYTMSRGIVKSTGYPLHSPVSPSFPLPCVTVCHHISIGVYLYAWLDWLTSGTYTRLKVPTSLYSDE